MKAYFAGGYPESGPNRAYFSGVCVIDKVQNQNSTVVGPLVPYQYSCQVWWSCLLKSNHPKLPGEEEVLDTAGVDGR